jgi:hypothetical protein
VFLRIERFLMLVLKALFLVLAGGGGLGALFCFSNRKDYVGFLCLLMFFLGLAGIILSWAVQSGRA